MTIAEPANPPKLPIDSEDVAWAAIPAPQSPIELQSVLTDVSTLFRLNPYYYFKEWKQTGELKVETEFRNESNDRTDRYDLKIEKRTPNEVAVIYDHGIKKQTIFSLEDFESGSRLVITEEYEQVAEGEREARTAEVDKSIQAWAESIRVYLRRHRRYGRIPGWKWYIRNLWIPMSPSARRIVWYIYLISVVEFFFFLFVLLIYLLEVTD